MVRASLERSTAFDGLDIGDSVTTLLSVATIAIELALPIALWWGPRSRRVALAAGLVFHASVGVGTAHDVESFVQLVSFGAVMLALYLAFFVEESGPARSGPHGGPPRSTAERSVA